MGFMSELVTLIWLIVEQSAVEQPVQTRFQITRVPGTGRALPGERRRLSAEPAAAAWHGEDAGAREDEQSLSLPAAKKKNKTSHWAGMCSLTTPLLCGSSRSRAWQSRLQICYC